MDNETAEQIARREWNAAADEYNQWDALGQDEKDLLISAAKKRRDNYHEVVS